MENYFIKECIPGYTGHIRNKKFTAGYTEGEINRRLVRKEPIEESRNRKNYFTRCESLAKDPRVRNKYDYQSNRAIGWIGSPTYDLFLQHIPSMYFK